MVFPPQMGSMFLKEKSSERGTIALKGHRVAPPLEGDGTSLATKKLLFCGQALSPLLGCIGNGATTNRGLQFQ
jgi:hypothetical protein